MIPTAAPTAAPKTERRQAAHSRPRRDYASRIDRPDLRAGNLVWWHAGLYEVETLEQHGERWIAVLVKPGDVGQLEVRCWFANVNELQAEPT